MSKNAINQHYLFEGSLIKNILENGIYFFQCLNKFMHGNYLEEINYAKYLTKKIIYNLICRRNKKYIINSKIIKIFLPNYFFKF